MECLQRALARVLLLLYAFCNDPSVTSFLPSRIQFRVHREVLPPRPRLGLRPRRRWLDALPSGDLPESCDLRTNVAPDLCNNPHDPILSTGA